MNTAAVLALIGSLYAQIVELQAEIEKLRLENSRLSSPS